ncbi:prostate stem cell antigen [Calypte anna]|nr:prostate stem cell antigen [Calypte anna]
MKFFLVLLLGAVLCLDTGSSLECYKCTLQLSNSKCQAKETCKENEECKTDVIRLVGLFNVISKGCEASCKALDQDYSVTRRNVSCCSSDLCNVNAGSSLRYSYGMAAGLAVSILWPFVTSKL